MCETDPELANGSSWCRWQMSLTSQNITKAQQGIINNNKIVKRKKKLNKLHVFTY